MDEVWKPVATHPGRYEVSNLGRVRTVERRAQVGPILRTFRAKLLVAVPGGRARNYLRVHLYEPERFAFVHCLVAEAFIGPRPFPGAVVLHKNDDGHDNRADHLRYGDRDENELDRHVARVAPALESAPF
jgi:hypothetical protein